ncbi:MAG TPA: hypothetical protein VK066_00260 [Chloroflexota bacterium]|nr:hypothetical protein [Chloroflexota bacterium]
MPPRPRPAVPPTLRSWPVRRRARLAAACLAAGLALAGVLGCAPGGGAGAKPGTNPSNVQSAPLPAEATGVLTYQRDGNVYALPLDSKAERKLTDFPPQSQAVFSARSPDGSQLAYVRVEGFGSTMWLSDATGGGERKLIDESASYATLEYPQWTPDGKGIVYTYHGFVVENGSIKGETIRAERVDAATGERTTLAPDAEGPTMAPDGTLVFTRLTRAGVEMVQLDPAGNEKVLLSDRSFVNMAAPRYSPDGKHIAFRAYGNGPSVGTRVEPQAPTAGGLATAVGALARQLLPGVAYAHGEPWDIWMVEANGGGVRQLAKLTEDDPTVTWSPDSRFSAASGGTGVYVIDASNGQITQLETVGGFGGIDWTR